MCAKRKLSDPRPKHILEEEIETRMRDYYARYYRDILGLPNWERRVEKRLSEDENLLPLIRQVETWSNESFGAGKKVLVVGSGTGAEFMALSKLGCEVYGIEPNVQAVSIGQLKAQLLGVNPSRLMRGYGERLPFLSDKFDFVWCFTVIEHVQDVQRCISEMIRVVKPLARIFIVTPDYRQFYEPHYKLTMPMFAPRWMLRFWLRIIRRPVKFLNTLRFVNSKFLARIFQDHPVLAFRIIHPWPSLWKSNPTINMRLVKWMTRNFDIHRDQYWILQKLDRPR